MLSARHPSSDGKRGEMALGMFAELNAKSSVFYGKKYHRPARVPAR